MEHFELITLAEVKELTGLSTSTIWRLRNMGDFPEPLRLSARRVMYNKPDVEAWLLARAHRRRKRAGTATEASQ